MNLYTPLHTHIRMILGVAVIAAMSPSVMGSSQGDDDDGERSEHGVWIDAAGDARIRRTDPGNNGVLDEDNMPDLLSVRIAGWSPTDAVVDPYTGVIVDGEEADLVLIDIVFAGLVNPPGPLGLGFSPFDPERFGLRPVYGFLEIDLDDQKNSGGELGDAAISRYLGNVARFGELPESSFGGRAAISANDYDDNFWTNPQLERTGAEYIFGFCGCFDPVLISEDGDVDGLHESGETFIVQGRFFHRVDTFSVISGVEGGSMGGFYDPEVNVRFAHDVTADQTTVTIVYALTMAGAALLTGEPEQSPDFFVFNHTSVEEAVIDLIEGAQGLNGFVGPEMFELVKEWQSRPLSDVLDPTKWDIRALFGVAYLSPDETLYAWTDVGFDETFGDFNSDAVVDAVDEAALEQHITNNDGGADDADGVVNGVVQIVDFGPNFSVFDVSGDGQVDSGDVDMLAPIVSADLNGDGKVNALDLALLLGAWGVNETPSDFNGDGEVDSADLAFLLGSWGPVLQ